MWNCHCSGQALMLSKFVLIAWWHGLQALMLSATAMLEGFAVAQAGMSLCFEKTAVCECWQSHGQNFFSFAGQIERGRSDPFYACVCLLTQAAGGMQQWNEGHTFLASSCEHSGSNKSL
jgi:hypothetical protein